MRSGGDGEADDEEYERITGVEAPVTVLALRRTILASCGEKQVRIDA